MAHIIFYDWMQFVKSFGLGGAVKPREEADEMLND